MPVATNKCENGCRDGSECGVPRSGINIIGGRSRDSKQSNLV
jgi:hypothetical protein